MKVNKNIHNKERWLRMSIGLLLISLVFWGPQNPWFALGIVPFLTGLVGWCPPYSLLGINTCSLKK